MIATWLPALLALSLPQIQSEANCNGVVLQGDANYITCLQEYIEFETNCDGFSTETGSSETFNINSLAKRASGNSEDSTFYTFASGIIHMVWFDSEDTDAPKPGQNQMPETISLSSYASVSGNTAKEGQLAASNATCTGDLVMGSCSGAIGHYNIAPEEPDISTLGQEILFVENEEGPPIEVVVFNAPISANASIFDNPSE
ncbi:hypothetical protein [Armatimonas sp.]|uniref:hypothetical protein n=1 Tax=Armatimonas sp. TaxID=1872638 RepID=UPI0037526FEC